TWEAAMTSLSEIKSNVQALDPSAKKQIAIEAAKDLSSEDKQAIAQALGPPSQNITNIIWLVVVIGFVIVFIGSFATMAYYYTTQNTNLDKMLTVFTTVSAFLAGLLAPSPVKNKE